MQTVLQELEGIEDTQVRYVLTRACASFGPMVHVLRGVDPRLVAGPAAKFDALIRTALANMLRGHHIAQRAWDQARLGTHNGGLGLRGSADHAEAAFLAACHQCADLDGWDLDGDLSYIAAKSAFEARVPEIFRPRGIGMKAQKQLSSMIQNATLQRLISEAPSIVDRARLRSTAGGNTAHKDAGAFWNAVPSQVLRLDIPPALFVTTAKWWLGLEVIKENHFCPWCGDPSDELGYHCLTCRFAGRLGVRHNAINNVLFFDARAAQMCPTMEDIIHPGTRLRSDLRTKILGVVKDGDVAVTHPLRQKYPGRPAAKASRQLTAMRWRKKFHCTQKRVRLPIPCMSRWFSTALAIGVRREGHSSMRSRWPKRRWHPATRSHCT